MSLVVDVRKRLGSFSLDVSFEVETGSEIVALLGPSGCGKSLTLKCIAGVLEPDEGRVVLNGRTLFDSAARVNLPPQRRRVGCLFQQYALFPTMTVERNIGAGAVGVSRGERARRVAEQVRAFRLEGLERLRPAQLSGGQQQRVALARILAGDPELLLLDEPFSALDGYLRWEVELELADALRAFPGGAVFVSHSRDEVYRLCDTVCVVSDGRSEPKLTVPELFAAPTTLAAALISGCKNVSRARPAGEKNAPGAVDATPAGEKDAPRAVDAAPAGEKDAPGEKNPAPDEMNPASGEKNAAPGALTALACDDWGVTLATALPVPPGVTHVGLRAHYLRVFAESERPPAVVNVVACDVDRVIDSTFSTIAMLRTPGGGLLRYECDKGAWAPLSGARRLWVVADPSIVMPLTGGEARA